MVWPKKKDEQEANSKEEARLQAAARDGIEPAIPCPRYFAWVLQ
jgi:hypothetical protein